MAAEGQNPSLEDEGGIVNGQKGDAIGLFRTTTDFVFFIYTKHWEPWRGDISKELEREVSMSGRCKKVYWTEWLMDNEHCFSVSGESHPPPVCRLLGPPYLHIMETRHMLSFCL